MCQKGRSIPEGKSLGITIRPEGKQVPFTIDTVNPVAPCSAWFLITRPVMEGGGTSAAASQWPLWRCTPDSELRGTATKSTFTLHCNHTLPQPFSKHQQSGRVFKSGAGMSFLLFFYFLAKFPVSACRHYTLAQQKGRTMRHRCQALLLAAIFISELRADITSAQGTAAQAQVLLTLSARDCCVCPADTIGLCRMNVRKASPTRLVGRQLLERVDY